MCTAGILNLYKLTNSPAVLLVVYFCVIYCTSVVVVSAREVKTQQKTQEAVAIPNNSIGRNEAKNNEPVKEVKLTVVSGKVDQKLNCSDPKSENKTECSMSSDTEGANAYVRQIINQMSQNRGMLMRTLYVTLSITGLVVAYFVIKSVWLRRKRTKSSMYGVLPVRGDRRDMEMKPLGDGDDDDDDDYTVFEVNGRKR
ncbi:unnamed protein product [Candidula unifasciata]|uniref:Uncharacterized protein n=1 Tax=Candidula unifasciata TaxID=100452 RepID=A0A8S4A1P0_9EUPU|nr:unnamed protein product [Candidula unifasciata]